MMPPNFSCPLFKPCHSIVPPTNPTNQESVSNNHGLTPLDIFTQSKCNVLWSMLNALFLLPRPVALVICVHLCDVVERVHMRFWWIQSIPIRVSSQIRGDACMATEGESCMKCSEGNIMRKNWGFTERGRCMEVWVGGWRMWWVTRGDRGEVSTYATSQKL